MSTADSFERPSPADVRAGAERLRGVAVRTPLERSQRLSDAVDADVWLKREDLQPVRSYKLRGAYNFIASLSDEERAAGVVCASAGNHGQGVAFTCRRLGVRCQVVLPRTTPRQKLERIVALGGEVTEVVMQGHTYDDAHQAAVALAASSGAVLVPPFDHPKVIAGQGTVALEVFEQLPAPPDLVVVPLGGGGLTAGVAVMAAAAEPRPRVVGVEPAGAPSMRAALDAGGPVTLPSIDGFVDGAAVRRAGDLTYAVVRDLVDDVVAVDEGSVCTTMLELYQSDGIIAEPAGALSVAALRDAVKVTPGSTVVCIVSGGNNDVSRYGEIVERSLVHEGLKHYFLVQFPQEPGALRGFLDGVLGPTDDITLFEYVKKNNRETGPALVGIEIAARADLAPLLERMSSSGLHIEPLEAGSPAFRFLV
ncbi:MAG TPA: threonine ammonia-lyase IlvA [Acidimicrobiales bacterium]|nr:threonine ammonia-lyase IlvA [Acidimicrobiales bacterium]